MIKDKGKVENIYNYLANLAKAHKSSANKHYGWTQFNKKDKNKGFSVQHYFRYDESCKNMTFELYEVDFNYKTGFFSNEENYKRIYIKIRVAKDFSELEIKECLVKDGAELFGFFQNAILKFILSKFY